MTLTAILLILVAACAHVAWNLVSKRQHPNLPFFAIALIFGNVVLSPIVLWHYGLFRDITPEVWQCLALTSLCQATYMAGLVGAYRSGHLSVAYPLARAIPVLLVTLSRTVWSGATFTPGLYAGIFLIVAGVLLLPMPNFSNWHWRHYRNLSCFFALLAGLGTTGYSLIDDHALQLFREAVGERSTPFPVTTVYAFMESNFTFLWLLLAILPSAVRRKESSIMIRQHWKTVFLASVGMILGYLLILVSLAYADDVAYVVAFRQISIPLGALAGVVILGEPAHRPKLVGVGLLFLGLVLTALG